MTKENLRLISELTARMAEGEELQYRAMDKWVQCSIRFLVAETALQSGTSFRTVPAKAKDCCDEWSKYALHIVAMLGPLSYGSPEFQYFNFPWCPWCGKKREPTVIRPAADKGKQTQTPDMNFCSCGQCGRDFQIIIPTPHIGDPPVCPECQKTRKVANGPPARQERCKLCGKMTSYWVEHDWSKGRICKECESECGPVERAVPNTASTLCETCRKPIYIYAENRYRHCHNDNEGCGVARPVPQNA
jgi:hypothetical protein